MAATTPAHRRVVIELEATGRPVSGVIREQGWSPRRFSGWLELIAALEISQPDAAGKALGKTNREDSRA